MGKITERLADLARRCDDLSPIAEPTRDILTRGNAERALAGTDVEGRDFAPLAPSTVKNRKGNGPPQAPLGRASSIVTGYVVQVVAAVGRLSILASWPDLDWLKYHISGTRRMPRRDPTGFRKSDRASIRDLMKAHIFRK